MPRRTPDTVRFRTYGPHRVTLTTAHPRSSYGLPILLVDGDPTAYGPNDTVVLGRGRREASPAMHAGHFVVMGLQFGATEARRGWNTPEAVAAAVAFLSQSPTYGCYCRLAERRARQPAP